MINKQVATAAEESSVIQSQRDTNIGYSADEVRGIIETLADQVPKFAAIATAIVDARLQSFEEKVMSRFEDKSATDTKAFADPDFQYLLKQAQYAYARSGDEETADILVDLIAERSTQQKRNRLTLSLNEAVEKSAYLTVEEFSELSLCYFFKMTVNNGIRNFPELCEYLLTHAGPLVPNISREASSYTYLASQACASIDISAISLIEVLKVNYSGLLSNGVDKSALEAALNPYMHLAPEFIIPCLHDKSKFQINALNKNVLYERLRQHNAEFKAEELWSVHSENLMDIKDFCAAAKPYYPEVSKLFQAWDETQIRSMTLTSVGLAIGYSNLKRLTDFKADLSIWIK